MRLVSAVAAALVVVSGCVPSSGPASLPAPEHEHGGAGGMACSSDAPPVGALPPAVPAWCSTLAPGIDTADRGANSWLDEFKSGASNVRLASAYRVFDAPRRAATTIFRTQHFAHNAHWMVDVAGHGSPPGLYEGAATDLATGPNNGGALMRPDRAFRFAEGRLVVEVDVAASMEAYHDIAWPEIVVTTAPAPTTTETDPLHAAGVFGGYPAVGCRLLPDRLPVCEVHGTDRVVTRLSARLAGGALAMYGGAPDSPSRDAAWRRCGETDTDDRCRDRFRLVVERDTVSLFVNDTLYMQHQRLPERARVPDELLGSDVYVYFGSWAYLAGRAVARFHWGRIAINR